MLQLDVRRERKPHDVARNRIELLYVVVCYNIQHLPIDT